ncbi:MAG: VanW family protein [Actinomycetota bacterium]
MASPAVTSARQRSAPGATKKTNGRASRSRVRIAGLAVGALVLAAFFVAVLERLMYAGDVMPGVHIDGVDLAGQSEADAYADLSALAATLELAPIEATIGGERVSADPSLLELDVDELATLASARSAARSGNPLESTLGAVLRRFRDDEVELHVSYSEAGLDGILDGWQRDALDGRVEGGLRFDGTEVIEIEPRAGIGVQRTEARRRLDRELHSSTRDPVSLPVGAVEPRIDAEVVARAAAEARALLRGDHEVVTDGATLTISAAQLASAMGTRIDDDRLDLTIEPELLRESLGDTLAALERAPVDATFEVTASNTVQVVPSQNGRQVDMQAVAEAILDGTRRIAAPLSDIVPDHNTAWAESLGIKEQVSTFTTRHSSGQARVTNIHRAADLIDNLVVEPGATFSLDDAIGARSPDRGFVVAPVFYGEFTEDFGGGVSQLATTFFNAVFFGGYEDVYHKPHTIYISRYPMGREATLNYGTVDVTFRNDSNTGVLIRTAYSESSITVTFYGDPEGKKVSEVDRRILAERPVEAMYYDCPGPPGADKENVCATLPLGETKEVEGGYTGYDVEYFRLIERPGAEPVRERFFWRYRMTPAVILVGQAAPTTTTTPGAPTETTPPSVTPTTPALPGEPAPPTPVP